MKYIHRKCNKCSTIYSHKLTTCPDWHCEKCTDDPWYCYFLSREKNPNFKNRTVWGSPVRDSYWSFAQKQDHAIRDLIENSASTFDGLSEPTVSDPADYYKMTPESLLEFANASGFHTWERFLACQGCANMDDLVKKTFLSEYWPAHLKTPSSDVHETT